jgi:UBX domain
MHAESGEARKAAAAERLPQEPQDRSAACRVAVQTPGGRITRLFSPGDAVQAVYDFALQALSDEQAEGEFVLVPAVPGGQPLSELQASLAEAGAAGGLLRLQWVD